MGSNVTIPSSCSAELKPIYQVHVGSLLTPLALNTSEPNFLGWLECEITNRSVCSRQKAPHPKSNSKYGPQ